MPPTTPMDEPSASAPGPSARAKTAKRDTSYIHVRIEPTPELEVKMRDLMREVQALVVSRLGDSARVTSVASMSEVMRPQRRLEEELDHGGVTGPTITNSPNVARQENA